MNPFASVRFIAVVLALVFGAVATQAQDLNAVRARMAQRLPQLDALKSSGAVGEDNRGYVAVRATRDNAGEIVSAENADRRVVYEGIAKQTGSSADAVGKARARQIAAQSAAGVWLQAEDGSWYQKK
jgi:uncharacterized protein